MTHLLPLFNCGDYMRRNTSPTWRRKGSSDTDIAAAIVFLCESATILRAYPEIIRPRGEEKKEKEQNPNFKASRWVVEVTHSFFNRFRKLLVRFEKKATNYLALLQFACAIIVWRKLIPVHKK